MQFVGAVVGLMDRALDLTPEVTHVRIPALKGSPWLLPGCCTVGCPLLQVCTLGWVKCREHISLLIILCIIVYVTNKAHPSLICIVITNLQVLSVSLSPALLGFHGRELCLLSCIRDYYFVCYMYQISIFTIYAIFKRSYIVSCSVWFFINNSLHVSFVYIS